MTRSDSLASGPSANSALDHDRRAVEMCWGATVRSDGGRLHLDVSGTEGSRLLGHRHPAVVAEMIEALGAAPSLPGLPGWSSTGCDELSESLARWASRSDLSVHSIEVDLDAALRVASELAGRGDVGGGPVLDCRDMVPGRNGELLQPGDASVVVLGPAMAAGLPIGIVLRRAGSGHLGSVRALSVSPLAAAAASATLRLIDDDGFRTSVAALVDYFDERMDSVATHVGARATIRSEGLCAEVRFDSPTSCSETIAELDERGVLVRPVGATAFAIAPPLTVRPAEIDVVTGSLRAALVGMPAAVDCRHEH